MLVLALILLAPALSRKLKIPDIVGLILAGVAVGPSGFNLLERDASFQIFGQVGILYLMFTAAVEINMADLQKNLGKGIGFGLITFAIPMAAGIFGAMWAFGAGIETAVLIASMYASHTLVSYPLVSKFHLQDNRGALIAVCGTIVAVLLALLALAEVVSMRTTGSFDGTGLLIMLSMMIVYGIGLGYFYPWLTRLFFRKISDPVSQYIFVLALVLFAALLAQLIGLEGILGAFYAGLVLNRLIPLSSALARNIKFVGNAIFIPYFLIGVGMLINPHVIFRSWNVGWIALNMVVVALGSKWVAAWIAQRIWHLETLDRRLIFGLTSGKAAATIAATMIGFQYRLLGEDLMNGAVVMILVCCLMASVVTERTSIKLRIARTAAEMERDGVESPTFARQLVALSNPLTADGLTRLAAFMRNPRNSSPISLLFVRDSDDGRKRVMGRAALQTGVQAAASMDLAADSMERFDLNIATGMANTARETNATDIIIGFHVKGNLVDSFHGQIAETLIGNTSKMVIMTRCFIPVDTIHRLVVVVWRNAQYESGFHAWVARAGNLAAALGCRIIFMADPHTSHFIEDIILQDGYGVRREYKPLETWDDFILLSAQIDEEDLIMLISARKGSISSCVEQDSTISYMARHFSRHNLALIYPGQFGQQ